MLEEPLPNEPVIEDDMIPLWNAFWVIHRNRQTGFGPGAIPLNAITAYCNEFKIRDEYDRQRFMGFIFLMDNAYMKAVSDVQEAERANNQSKSRSKR